MATFRYSFNDKPVFNNPHLDDIFKVVGTPTGDFYDIESLWDERTQKVGMFVLHFWKENRFGPTIREIQQATEIQSLSTVKEAVDRLRDAGYVTYIPKQARTLVPSDKLLEQA